MEQKAEKHVKHVILTLWTIRSITGIALKSSSSLMSCCSDVVLWILGVMDCMHLSLHVVTPATRQGNIKVGYLGFDFGGCSLFVVRTPIGMIWIEATSIQTVSKEDSLKA